ncbi:MAG: KdsC family phosphatase [Desulfovibrio sp.]
MTENTLPKNAPALLVYDFDGVMTDNRVIVREDGLESVVCNRGDGLGINIIKKMDIPQIILSTETNPVVAARAKKIGIPAIHGSSNKKETLQNFCQENDIAMTDVFFVGNDMNDYEVMEACGFGICPSDSHKNIITLAGLTTEAKGGYGVIRELADLLHDKYAE